MKAVSFDTFESLELSIDDDDDDDNGHLSAF